MPKRGRPVNRPKEDQPKAVQPNTEVDLNKIGVRTITTMKDKPKIKTIDHDPESGKATTVFDLSSSPDRPVSQELAQPYLTEAEVEKIGIYNWHCYKGNSEVYTTVVNGRRFKLTKDIFEQLKDKGLVMQDG